MRADDRTVVRVLRALADTKRFRMVENIAAAGEMSCGQIAELFDLSQPTISHHLKLLGDSGVLKIRHDAKHRFLSVDHDLLARVLGAIPSRIARPSRRRSPKRRATDVQ
jgi:ArsR family transcriptional regulator